MEFINIPFILLTLSILLIIFLMFYVTKKKPLSQLQLAMLANCICTFILATGVFTQSICYYQFGVNPIYFENIIYIGTCFLPVSLLFTSLILWNTKITFKKSYLLFFVIPFLSLLMIWTNDFHHLFYEQYSLNMNEMKYGSYFYVHSIYSYGLTFASMIILIYSSIKTSGFFSKQSILILLASIIPTTINLLGYIKVINITVYATPISFAITILLYAIAILKFKFLTISPIALQKIVDRISDSYIVLNENNVIGDFNKTFLDTFNLQDSNVRNVNIFDLLKSHNSYLVNEIIFKDVLIEVRHSSKTLVFEKEFPSFNKHFHIEINAISSKGNFLGTLILFKDTTQHIQDMQTIKDNQDMLMEKERLASLGQLIGGIAHNLKTPIMSISGAAEGLKDLIKEYDSSIEDSEVTTQDHHDIAKDMSEWVEKIKEYTEYMSDVITAVKGQAVVMSEQDSYLFTIDELVKRVDLLMKHELKNALINLKISIETDKNLKIRGNVNSLVQVINNMISNSIQAYNGKTNESIEFKILKEDDNIILSIKDYAGGLPKEVSDKLFKEMITTKGKNGTGLGLFMSYSNIRAHFNGNITFSSTPGVGTEFKIILPTN